MQWLQFGSLQGSNLLQLQGSLQWLQFGSLQGSNLLHLQLQGSTQLLIQGSQS